MRFLRNIFVVALVVVGGCKGGIYEELPTYEQSTLVGVGDMAPTFVTELVDGRSVALEEYRGKDMLLILFSHTCPDCKRLLDDLQVAIVRGEATLPILAIGRDGTVEELLNYRATNGYTIDMAPDANRAIFNLYATTYVPRAYRINAEGRIVKFTIEYEQNYISTLL